MRVTVNGEELQVETHTTVAELLRGLGLPECGVAVALNSAVLSRSEWDSTVPAGASLEVLTAVQGG
jgi:sulfur carrier protein